ncbi:MULTISPECIES: response regulator transcription factor [unclassified Novosphingobium]|uniref:response regulator n=1 Tax=unclassified Novosphingobium TaxID=2644732 RepID=UPI00144111AF|nr:MULTISPECIES: response regulator transcription factor [unclassified Novosphingobium]MBB3359379.1 DNA-binding response OmpR family regulator [Novosphingobium sp. BK256]MBB3375739.1 DNA-binding response OmpR family regulator [Novosphingobium sp. BK280]MBB3380152.1 DNA-binding response OmpR family regulator [Novosphingobium sp. BK258]MBB3421846.1 DNA-binding response OmpR family regulator [Novosphingobium sp. BK267]MBB3450502.1 DNA-binding response OmpR family regulator [Novosphingobium sp. BK
MRILLVEDDAPLARALAACLAGAGLTVDHAASSEEAELYLAANTYAALVLDRGLPDGDGLALLARLRRAGHGLAVVVLTARGEVQARIAGLDAGADDYMAKPFSPDELLARLRAVLRRNGTFQGREIACANLVFDLDNLSLRVGGRVVALSAREAGLLGLLLRREGQVVTKRLAEDQLFGANDPLGSNAIEVYVHRLRQKLDAAQGEAEIVTVRGVGYIIKPRA